MTLLFVIFIMSFPHAFSGNLKIKKFAVLKNGVRKGVAGRNQTGTNTGIAHRASARVTSRPKRKTIGFTVIIKTMPVIPAVHLRKADVKVTFNRIKRVQQAAVAHHIAGGFPTASDGTHSCPLKYVKRRQNQNNQQCQFQRTLSSSFFSMYKHCCIPFPAFPLLTTYYLLLNTNFTTQ